MEVVVPALQESKDSVIISALYIHEGESVSEGQVLLEIETTKVVLEITAVANGVISDLSVSLGDHVQPEQSLMQLNGPEVSLYEESTIIEEDSESCNVESEIVEPFKKNKGRSIGLWIVGLFSVILISIKLIY